MSLFNTDWNGDGKIDFSDEITDFFIMDQILADNNDDDDDDDDDEDDDDDFFF